MTLFRDANSKYRESVHVFDERELHLLLQFFIDKKLLPAGTSANRRCFCVLMFFLFV
jgi:hypothetical protein